MQSSDNVVLAENRNMNQLKKMENPEMYYFIYSQIFTRI